ncbi:MAG: glycosyltransferase family 4 protein [Pseudomonadota bacterium]
MNILYHHRTMGRGAEGVHIANMVNAFECCGHSVSIISPPGVDPRNDAGKDVFELKKKDKDTHFSFGFFLKVFSRKFPQFLFELLEIIYNFYAFFAVGKKLRNAKFDLIYERYAFFGFITGCLAKRRKIPFVLEVNETSGLERFRGQAFISLTNWFEKKILSQADLIVVVSSFLKSKIVERGVAAQKILVLPNGVDLEKFNIESETSSARSIREKYDIRDNDIVFGFVGWFADWDRLDKLIEIFHEVHTSHTGSKLMLVGDGAIRQKLEKQVTDLRLQKNVIFTGPVERNKVQHYIAAIDICVLPHSNKFGSPIVLFEFMAMAKTVIAPMLDPITDVLTNGRTGLLFQVGDFVGLKKILITVLTDESLRKKLGYAAKEEIVENHTWHRKAEQVMRALRLSYQD